MLRSSYFLSGGSYLPFCNNLYNSLNAEGIFFSLTLDKIKYNRGNHWLYVRVGQARGTLIYASKRPNAMKRLKALSLST